MDSGGLTRRRWLASATAIAAEVASSAQVGSDPLAWTIVEAAAALAKRKISSEELTSLCLERISKLDKQLNSFITVSDESATVQARESDRRRKAGRMLGRLDGVP